jgi:hypothetical protein
MFRTDSKVIMFRGQVESFLENLLKFPLVAAAIIASWIKLAITSLPSPIEFLINYPKHLAIIKDVNESRPVLIEEDLTTILCEESASITGFNNVGDGCDYVTSVVVVK